MAGEEEDHRGSDGDRDEEEGEELDDLWDSFAEQWERAFQRISEAEDSQLRKINEQVEQLVAQKAVAIGADMEARMAGGDLKAHHNSKVARAVIETEHLHAAKVVQHNAEASRASLTANAHKDSDDMVRDIEARSAQRRLEAEAKRKETKKKREAEAEARRASRERAASGAAPPPAAGGSGPSSSSSQQQERPRAGSSSGAPPPGSRPPRVVGAAAAAAKSFASWAEFDSAWKAFEARLRDKAGAADAAPWLGFADIPWPSGLSIVSGITPQDAPAACKKKLRAAMLRWHPDKWAPVLAAVLEPSRPEVIAKVQEVARQIIDEKQRHS